MKKSTVLTIIIVYLNSFAFAQFPAGINVWMNNKYIHYPTNPGGYADFPPTQNLVSATGVKYYRIGGSGYDIYGTAIGDDSAHNDYIAAIDKIKHANPDAGFLIQVPFHSDSMTSILAKILVLNIKNAFPSQRFYYAIGNEWDRYVKPGTSAKYSSSEISDTIKKYAMEMKSADTTIRIVAPALSNFKAMDRDTNLIMKRLLTSIDSITGKIAASPYAFLNGHYYYVDCIDFHSYGGTVGILDTILSSDYDSIRAGIINYPDNGGFKKNLDTLQIWLHHANIARSPSPLTFAISEMNVCSTNPVKAIANGDTTTNCTQGIASRSFFAGQMWADYFSTIIASSTSPGNAKCEFIMPWSIHEHNGDGSITDLGMTKGTASDTTAPIPLSTYHHFNLMTHYFNQKFYRGNSSISPNVKTFASIDPNTNFIYVMILNRNKTNYSYNIGFSGADAFQFADLHLHFPFTSIYTMDTTVYPFASYDTLFGNSTVVLQFNCHGAFIMKKVYNLDDALNDQLPRVKQAETIPTDITYLNKNIINCGHAGGTHIGGIITSSTTYVNDTIYITSDLSVSGASELTFVSCLVIVSEGVKISTGNHGGIVLLNTVMAGCEGKTWKGIEMMGNYYATERLHITNSSIFNASRTIWTDKIPDIAITQSVFANGTSAINLNSSHAFTITKNLIAGYTMGISTKGTVANYLSEIKDNRIMDVETAMTFTNDMHNYLDIFCNEMFYTQKGIAASTTHLKDQGTLSISAQNRFTKTVPDINLNYLDISGSSPLYYYGPSETVPFSKPNISNITTHLAFADRTCYHTFMETCQTSAGITENLSSPYPEMLIYPNPTAGTFTIGFTNLTSCACTLTIYDRLGKQISNTKIQAKTGSTTLQIENKGLYFVSLQDGKERITQKVIVE